MSVASGAILKYNDYRVGHRAFREVASCEPCCVLFEKMFAQLNEYEKVKVCVCPFCRKKCNKEVQHLYGEIKGEAIQKHEEYMRAYQEHQVAKEVRNARMKASTYGGVPRKLPNKNDTRKNGNGTYRSNTTFLYTHKCKMRDYYRDKHNDYCRLNCSFLDWDSERQEYRCSKNNMVKYEKAPEENGEKA